MIERDISEKTAQRWMYFLDFRPQEKGKNYFVDGHECNQWDGPELEVVIPPVLNEGERRTVCIVQDESLFNTNDSVVLSWLLISNH